MTDDRHSNERANPVIDNFDLWTSVLLNKSTAGRGSNGRRQAYGVEKLRELILGAALRGLFGEANDSLPATIDQSIKNARDNYHKRLAKKPKEAVVGAPLLREFKLPSGWTWKRVGELCDLQTGATPSTQRRDYFGGDIRWLVSGDINKGIIDDCEGRITEKGLANSNCKILPPKTVLIALNGQGKTRASVALLNVPAACNQSLVGMVPFDPAILDPMFLLLSLRYRYYEIRDITGQNQRRGLNMGLVGELSVPLPPIAEQRRIVARVNELVAACDQLERQHIDSIEAHQILVNSLLGSLSQASSRQELSDSWLRISDHLHAVFTSEHSIDQLRRTILQLAVKGKLVSQHSDDESASELLVRIADKKQRLIEQGLAKKEKRLLDIAEGEIPYRLPKLWAWARIGTIASATEYGLSEKTLEDPSGVPVLKMGDIVDGEVILGDHKTVPVNVSGLPGLLLSDGDLLYNRTNSAELVGKTGLFVGPAGTYTFASYLIRIRLFKDLVVPKYVNLCMNAPEFRATEIEPHLKQQCGQANVNCTTMRSMRLALPPFSEQRRIVAKVDELMAICDALKARLTEAQTTQARLADVVVERATAEQEQIPKGSLEREHRTTRNRP